MVNSRLNPPHQSSCPFKLKMQSATTKKLKIRSKPSNLLAAHEFRPIKNNRKKTAFTVRCAVRMKIRTHLKTSGNIIRHMPHMVMPNTKSCNAELTPQNAIHAFCRRMRHQHHWRDRRDVNDANIHKIRIPDTRVKVFRILRKPKGHENKSKPNIVHMNCVIITIYDWETGVERFCVALHERWTMNAEWNHWWLYRAYLLQLHDAHGRSLDALQFRQSNDMRLHGARIR